MSKIKRPLIILPIIIFSQFAGTSTWFASNAILGDLQTALNLGAGALGYMTSAVQFGFITGTLLFAVLVISDRFSPRYVFFSCSTLNAAFNLGIYFLAEGFWSLLIVRFLTGFMLAGIYPVGMKIAAGWYQKGLGKALGFLVGALVLGTAFPHLLKAAGQSFDWEVVIFAISGLAFLGGISMFLLVPDGPFLSKGTKFDSKALRVIFQSKALRAAAFGYFGHMWELYAVWAFFPVFLAAYGELAPQLEINISLWSFFIIAAGFLGCAIGGLISLKTGSVIVAFVQLLASGLLCLFSPLLFDLPPFIFLLFLVFWGVFVVGDSPQFSALAAKTAPPQFVGSALTIINSIGFAISIVSIQFLNYLLTVIEVKFLFIPLLIGPMLGLIALRPLMKVKSVERGA